MSFCYVCGGYYAEGREMTCSQPCHDKLVGALIARWGEFKKVVRQSTGEAFKVPTVDIIEKGIREQDLDQYPRWEDGGDNELSCPSVVAKDGLRRLDNVSLKEASADKANTGQGEGEGR